MCMFLGFPVSCRDRSRVLCAVDVCPGVCANDWEWWMLFQFKFKRPLRMDATSKPVFNDCWILNCAIFPGSRAWAKAKWCILNWAFPVSSETESHRFSKGFQIMWLSGCSSPWMPLFTLNHSIAINEPLTAWYCVHMLFRSHLISCRTSMHKPNQEMLVQLLRLSTSLEISIPCTNAERKRGVFSRTLWTRWEARFLFLLNIRFGRCWQ